jgi:hypothetical protein
MLTEPATLPRFYTGPEFRRITGRSDATLRLWRRKGMPYTGGGLLQVTYTDESVEWVKRGGLPAPREAEG